MPSSPQPSASRTLSGGAGSVPDLDPPSSWIWNEASERFGVIVYGDELPESIGWAQDLVGSEPDVYEEFDSA